MTFAKLAAQAIYPASDDEEARREDEEGRYSEWLKWAIGAGLLTAGAAAVFYNRDKIREAMGGRIIDSRTKLDAWLTENVGTTAAGVGGGVGLATAFGPGRKYRLFAGDMAEQRHLPGLGRKLMQTGDEHATKLQDIIGRWASVSGVDHRTMAARVGEMINEATSEGGENTVLGRFNRSIKDLYAGYDPDADPIKMVEGQKGKRLYDPSGRFFQSRSTKLGTPHTEMQQVLTNMDSTFRDASTARQMLNQHLAGGGDFKTFWGQLSPQQRTAMSLEGDFLRRTGISSDRLQNGVLVDPDGPRLSGFSNAVRSAMEIKPNKHKGWRTAGRVALGSLVGGGIGTGISTGANWIMGD